MACKAEPGIPLLHAARVESGSMRTHAQRPETRVTLHAIGLFVAGRTTFQRLPRGFTVVEEKGWLRIVEPRFQPPRRTHATLLMTVPAETRDIVAVRALQVPVVCRAAVPLHEVGWMITGTEMPYCGTTASGVL